jgi:hypothetical protein
MVGWWFVKQPEDSSPQILVVDLAVRLGLGGEYCFGATAGEFVPVFSDEAFAYA